MLVTPLNNVDTLLIKGTKYLVLDISVTKGNKINYGIQDPEDSETVISVDSENFEIIDSSIPWNWSIEVNNGKVFLGPKRWLDDNLWNDSFWEDYYGVNGNIPTEEAVRVFKEELEIMKREAGLLDEDKQEEDW